MASLTFERMGAGRKAAMLKFVQHWQRTDKPVAVLEEGLSILANPGRWKTLSTARKNGDDDVFGIAVDYSKDAKGWKGALPREDAGRLLELVLRIRANMPLGQEDNAELFATALDRVSRVLLNGEHQQAHNTDDLVQDIANAVIRGIVPHLAEPTLL